MKTGLMMQALLKGVSGLIAAMVLLFVPAGTFSYKNGWLSRTVEIQEDQKVIDTGLYGLVRHPMYLATIILFLAMPLVLGSWISFVLMLLYPVVLVKRITGEEKVLEEGLPGYIEYKKKVKYRLFPLIW